MEQAQVHVELYDTHDWTVPVCQFVRNEYYMKLGYIDIIGEQANEFKILVLVRFKESRIQLFKVSKDECVTLYLLIMYITKS